MTIYLIKGYLGYAATTLADAQALLTALANPALAAQVAAYLGRDLGRADVGTFSDGEVHVEICENVRGTDCFVLQSTSAPANTHLMELLIMIDTLRRASAGRITAVIPQRWPACRGDVRGGRLHPDVVQDVADFGAVGDEGNDAHLPTAQRTQKREHLVDAGDQHRPKVVRR